MPVGVNVAAVALTNVGPSVWYKQWQRSVALNQTLKKSNSPVRSSKPTSVSSTFKKGRKVDAKSKARNEPARDLWAPPPLVNGAKGSKMEIVNGMARRRKSVDDVARAPGSWGRT